MLFLDDLPARGRRVDSARGRAAAARGDLAAAEAELRDRFGVMGRAEAQARAEELFTEMMDHAERYIAALKELDQRYAGLR